MKVLAATGDLDERFIAEHTSGFDELAAALDDLGFDELERLSGASRPDMERFAAMYAAADSAIFVWSMGLTQHAFGSQNVRAIINLALARGNVGPPGRRPDADPRALRGPGRRGDGRLRHGLPGRRAGRRPESAAELSRQWGFDVPGAPGLSAEEMVEAAADGRARGALLERRQLPRRAARPGAGGRAPRPRAGARAPGHRGHHPDAGGSGRGRGAAARRHPLRAARRRHRDHHRAAHRLQPADPRAQGRGGPHRVGDPQRPRRARRPGPRPPHPHPVRTGHPRRDRPGRAHLRGHRDPREDRRPGAVGRRRGSATAGSSRPPTAGPTSPSSSPRSGRSPRVTC